MSNRKFSAIIEDPSTIPDNLEPHLEAILRMLEQLAQDSVVKVASRLDNARSFAELSAAETESTIAILGERGSGKTSLLQFVCARLLNDQLDLVLPIIRPERFAHRDTLTGWVLAALHRTMELDYPDKLGQVFDVGGVTQTLDEWIERVRRQEALVQRGYGDGLHEQDLTLAEFGRDVSELNSYGATFAANWGDLVDQMLKSIFPDKRKARPPLLIIAIDDADLRPELLPELFTQIRWLASCSAVAVLFCASERTTEHALISHYLKGGEEGGSTMEVLLDRQFMTMTDVIDTVHKQLKKALPAHLRTSIPQLSLDERLLFKPFDDSQLLVDLMGEIPYEGVHSAAFSDLFVLQTGSDSEGVDILPSPYAQCLSPIPRDLEHLHRALKRIVGSSGKEDTKSAQEAIRAVISHAVAWSSTQSPSEFRQPIGWIQRKDRTDIELYVQGLDFGAARGAGYVIRRLSSEDLDVINGVRRIDPFSASIPRAQVQRVGKDSEEPPIELPGGLTHTIHLASQVARESGVFSFGGVLGRYPTPGGAAWSDTLEVWVDREPTDNRFILVPDWKTYYEYFLYSNGWNRMIDIARGLTLTELASSNSLLEWFVLGHLELICEIQKSRSLPPSLFQWEIGALQSVLENETEWDRRILKRMDVIQSRFEELYSVADEESPRDKAFQDWFDVFLVWMANQLALSQRVLEWIMDARSDVIDGSGASLDTANEEAVDMLSRRIRNNIDRNWVEPLISTLRQLDVEAAHSISDRLREARATRTREFLESVSRLEEAGVPEALTLRMKAFGFTEEIRKELLDIGVPREFVDSMTQRFLKPESSLSERQDQIEGIITGDGG